MIQEQPEVEITSLTMALHDSSNWSVCRTGHRTLQCRLLHIVSHVALPGTSDSVGTWGTWQPQKHLFQGSDEGLRPQRAAGIC